MPKFFNSDVAELAHQLTISPRRLRVEQIRRIANLVGLIESDRAYPFDFVCYHITKYRKRGPSTGSFRSESSGPSRSSPRRNANNFQARLRVTGS